MTAYPKMTAEERKAEYAEVTREYEELKARGLNLNMARGKPGKAQLDLVSDIFSLDVYKRQVDDVVQLVGVCEVECLPDLALVGLAVADDAEHVAVTAIDLVAQSGAGGGGGALAQRAGGQIHAGGQLPVGVAGELGVRMVEGISFLHGIVAHQAKSGVSHGARVALGPVSYTHLTGDRRSRPRWTGTRCWICWRAPPAV